MYFDPQTTKYPYPEFTDEHYINVIEKTHHVVDENYPYIDNSKSFRFKRFWVRFLLNVIVFPVAKIWYGLKVKGKKHHEKSICSFAVSGTICCARGR